MAVVSMSKQEFDRLEVLLGFSWPSACRRRLRVTQPEAAPGVSFAGRFQARRGGQPGLETARPAEQQPSA